MRTSWRNSFAALTVVVLSAALASVSRATPIDHITFLNGSSNYQFTAGVTTTSASTSLFFVNCFRNGNQAPDQNGEVITITLIDGQAVPGGLISPPQTFTATFTISSNVVTYGDTGHPIPLKFFHAGSGMALKVTAAVVSTATVNSPPVTVGPGAASQLLMLAQGMTRQLGRDPSAGFTGFVGTPANQDPGHSFPVTVIVTDDWFNKVTSASNLIVFPPVPLVTVPASGNVVSGEKDFNFVIDAARTSVPITATSSGLGSGAVTIPMTGPEPERVFPFPSPFNPAKDGRMFFRVLLNDPKTIKIIVQDRFGQDVWRTEVPGAQGQTDVAWDGHNEHGNLVAAGVYNALLEVGGNIKSKKRFGVVK